MHMKYKEKTHRKNWVLSFTSSSAQYVSDLQHILCVSEILLGSSGDEKENNFFRKITLVQYKPHNTTYPVLKGGP